MVADELLEDLDRHADGVVALPARLLAWWATAFASRYVGDRGSAWWWQSLTCAVHAEVYGDGLDRAARALSWGPVLLLVTDERPEPVAGFLGFAADLFAMLRGARACEFVVVTPSLDRFVFDTHSNMLVFGPTPDVLR